MGMLGADPKNTEKVTSAVKEVSRPPVFVKLSPNVKDINDIARAAENGGADGITAINTLKGMAIDIERKRPILSNIFGGLSGPALKNVALRCVWDIHKVVDIPIIGCGGIKNWRDAIEFILCGSTAVQIGTAITNSGFEVYKEVSEGISKYLEINGFNNLREIVGLAHEA
jgi:dihydroorotate dehydrogenase (NAD+) catalytic subunit